MSTQAHHQLHTESKLLELALDFQSRHLNDLFAENGHRFEQLSVEHQGLFIDFSKQRLDQTVIASLVELANEKKLDEWIKRLFSTEAINHTEDRSAMHWALRMPKLNDPSDPNFDVNQKVHQQLDRMSEIVHQIRRGQFRGATGEKITDVVNIGVGGSDLGPLMVCHALEQFATIDQVRVHFASTMDGSQLSQIVRNLRPASTLFIISSKSFTTIDTLSNADTAKAWLSETLGMNPLVLQCHFIGVSSSTEKMTAWGIAEKLQLNLWEWVGGRYSLWSTIGLPIAISIGMENFKSLLEGAYEIDQHFQNAAWDKNLPVLLALIGIWNNNYLNIHTHAILPYDGRLEYLTSYLQQLEMESNGKSVNRAEQFVRGSTCPIIWGEVGPNAQHAFYQLLHQGTVTVSTDFMIAKQRYHESSGQLESEHKLAFQQQHQLSIANCLAQSRLLAFGSHAVAGGSDMPAYRQYSGNKPSTTIVMPSLSPYYLGALVALYEHKVFVQSVIWDINPFDQWGVEMGKIIAQDLMPILTKHDESHLVDQSTMGLIDLFLN
ncbi:glucose-6-phosphate isomerase [Acinetobacter sp. A3.8]|uniref:Glucose-6-phosphate isomerase n=1 Tax=Acinetobacter sedimenti TaxID=2919922 RepID=A0A9X1WYH7_9GAMM|nr:glucose-6-phosphate isomerase [Acinetobacter sedimenti]MCJ8145820.1 glucose-6-phosphate isomerase [Acinetobacter sedimenti]